MAKAERAYMVYESYEVVGSAEVWATSKAEAIHKVKDAFGTPEAYEFWYETGHAKTLSAHIERMPDGRTVTRPMAITATEGAE